MDEPTTFRVVVNHEEQYAIWPARQPIPSGWRDTEVTGDKDACLAHVEEVWTDMRPRSVRVAMSPESMSPESMSPESTAPGPPAAEEGP